MEFPRSCVIYLRTTKNTPDVEEVELKLPDGQVCVYRVPTVKVERYTKDSIFEKNLLMLLPFYVMRYEESAHTIGDISLIGICTVTADPMMDMHHRQFQWHLIFKFF